LPAFIRRLRQVRIGHRRIQVCARLVQLTINFRRVDLGQQVTFVHPGTYIRVPGLKVAAGARVDRRLHVGGDISGKYQLTVGLRFGGLDCCDRYLRVGSGALFEMRSGDEPHRDADHRDHDGHEQQYDQDLPGTFAQSFPLTRIFSHRRRLGLCAYGQC
jgi:hypothetical protein